MTNNAPSFKHILLDTNILQYLGKTKSDISNKLIEYMGNLLQRKFVFGISSFCIFELLDGATKNKETELLKAVNIFVRFDVSQEVLLTSARLSSLYRQEKAEYQHIGDGDKILAATSLLTNSLILTANMRDFPRPFFIEEEVKHMLYKEGHNEKVLSFYLLKADIEGTLYRFERRS